MPTAIPTNVAAYIAPSAPSSTPPMPSRTASTAATHVPASGTSVVSAACTAWRQLPPGVDDDHAVVAGGPPASDQPLRVSVRRAHHAASPQRAALDADHVRRTQPVPARDHQRRLREPVARIERLTPEPRSRRLGRKALEDVWAHRLGAMERHIPARQIERADRGVRNPAHTVVVRKARPAAGRHSMARDRLQPHQRPLHEVERRHQVTCDTEIRTLQHVPDQSHIMIQRQPAGEYGAIRIAPLARAKYMQ
jgi:hypothetical protein